MTVDVDESGPLDRAERDVPVLRSLELGLHLEFPGVPADQVRVLVDRLWTHFADAPVRDFVPLLVRRQAREALRDHLGPRPAQG